jgi:hypothetical protein
MSDLEVYRNGDPRHLWRRGMPIGRCRLPSDRAGRMNVKARVVILRVFARHVRGGYATTEAPLQFQLSTRGGGVCVAIDPTEQPKSYRL